MNCAKAKRSLEDSYKILRSELVAIADKEKKLKMPKKEDPDDEWGLEEPADALKQNLDDDDYEDIFGATKWGDKERIDAIKPVGEGIQREWYKPSP